MKKLGISCLLVLGAFFSLSARAVTASSDYTGLWWNAAESGWGMNLIQQEQILFLTLFVYGANNGPTWFVGPRVEFASANAAGDRTYTGGLFKTTGTAFGVTPFNPESTTVEAVGTITFVGRADGTASVQYTAGPNTVNKTIVRQTWGQPNFTLNTATSYSGSQAETASGCANAGNNGRSSGTYSQIALYINAATMRMEVSAGAGNGGLCVFQGGNYVQEGRFGRATLTGACSEFQSSPMTWQVREVEVGSNYFTMQYTMTGGPDGAGCTFAGVFTGAKK